MGEHFFVVAVNFAIEVVFCGFRVCSFFGATAECDDFGIRVRFEGGDVFARYPTCPDDAYFHFAHGIPSCELMVWVGEYQILFDGVI